MENWSSQCAANMESPAASAISTADGSAVESKCTRCRCSVRPNPVCLRRLLTVAMFLLPWTLCSAAPLSGLNQDTPAGNHTAIVNTRRRHHHHQKNSQHSHQKHHHQHRHEHQSKHFEEKKHYKHEDNNKNKVNYDEHIMKAATTNLPVFVSDLVVFSKDRPPMAPWEMNDIDSLPEDRDSKNDKWTQKDSTAYHKEVNGKVIKHQAVCDSRAQWVQKETAVDIFGHNITVMDTIRANTGEHVSQWFYETACVTSGSGVSSCRGIDTQTWDSECLSSQSFVYAMVRNENGEEGWNWIRLSTACNCALKSRRVNRRATYPFVDLTETERR
ncbi:LOW QUALITY PROTEIN: uncharacterized protein [Amphiura filiformis]|uniref:LOW QUALITY PROTEIN: uncharacterized protein n=1 Tax=Amphiura filiformis TaxID=82378 RepID=UPI003B2221DB